LLPAGLPFGWRGVGLVVAGVLLLSVLLEPAWVEGQPTLCVMHRTTGVPCPGCGLTRSFVATAHGDLGGAFAFHAFGPLLFLASALGLLALVGWTLSGREPLSRSALVRLRPVGWTLLAVWLVWAAARALDHVL
jgi:hypothetical protein